VGRGRLGIASDQILNPIRRLVPCEKNRESGGEKSPTKLLQKKASGKRGREGIIRSTGRGLNKQTGDRAIAVDQIGRTKRAGCEPSTPPLQETAEKKLGAIRKHSLQQINILL